MQKEFIITDDGSQTIYLPDIDEHYHSTFGAVNESEHVYIKNGFYQLNKSEISVLEIGFGTGLNALLTFEHAKKTNTKVNYYSIEKYPLTETEYSKLKYWNFCNEQNPEVFTRIHSAIWNKSEKISENFILTKVNSDLLTHNFQNLKFDLVYYDAFAPGKQAEMWTDDVLVKVANTLVKNGIFVTYCSKGSVRRALISAGIAMERVPGPVGKKEILRGKRL